MRRRKQRKGNKLPEERSHWRTNAVACPTQYGHKWSREGSKKWGDKFCENAVNADECEVIHMRKMWYCDAYKAYNVMGFQLIL